MVTPTFNIGHQGRVRSARSTRADGECLRYRLDVVASSAADVVQSAGGWLYDRVMAGWEVTVMLPHGCDTRALRILGVRAVDSDEQPDPAAARSHSLAVSAEAFTADARVREKVLEAMGDRLTEVALWGDGWPLAVDRAMNQAQHVLSMAARRFKGHALAAAGIGCGPVDPTETLLCDAATRLD
ncbi:MULTISPECIES: hypothetical protein [unclassified Mycobacterium]|uniref:hypothetical protein n=1 Tax=unclassified Mycobacterium TaxID=2642494 RepID=UPI0007FDFE70|nr:MULTISPECIES: hypothetical protein [unclassified Mycobacterium]OBG99615.1 hypothetical protein A5696_18260 [Mycobacterium sp. E2699]OBI47791.1 hypothetical protein A5705_17260 [Mycobacterium sp. E787]